MSYCKPSYNDRLLWSPLIPSVVKNTGFVLKGKFLNLRAFHEDSECQALRRIIMVNFLFNFLEEIKNIRKCNRFTIVQ